MTSVIKVSQLMALNMFVDELIVMISDLNKIIVSKDCKLCEAVAIFRVSNESYFATRI